MSLTRLWTTVLGCTLLLSSLAGTADAKFAENTPPIAVRWQAPADLGTQLTEARRKWTQANPGAAMTLPIFAELADAAYETSKEGAAQTLENWAFNSTNHPWIVVGQVAAVNTTSDTAWLNVTVSATLDAHQGEWKTDPTLLMTDVAHMRTSGHWLTLSKQQWRVVALPPGSTRQWAMPPVNILTLLAQATPPNTEQPTAWIDQLRLTVTLKRPDVRNGRSMITSSHTLLLEPDYFAVPFW